MSWQFHGETYDPARDFERLRNNTQRVFSTLLDGRWHSILELQKVGGSAARTRVSNLGTTFQMPISSETLNEEGTLWKYRLRLDEVDPEMARRVLENDLTEAMKKPRPLLPADLRAEIGRLVAEIPEGPPLVKAWKAVKRIAESQNEIAVEPEHDPFSGFSIDTDF